MPLSPSKVHNPEKFQGPTWLRISTFNVTFKNSSIRANCWKLNVRLQGTDSITSIPPYYDTMKYHVAVAENEAALYVLSGLALQVVLLSIKKKASFRTVCIVCYHLCSKQGDHMYIYICVYAWNISGNSHKKLVTVVAPGEWKLIGGAGGGNGMETYIYPFVLGFWIMCILTYSKMNKRCIKSKNNSPTPKCNFKKTLTFVNSQKTSKGLQSMSTLFTIAFVLTILWCLTATSQCPSLTKPYHFPSKLPPYALSHKFCFSLSFPLPSHLSFPFVTITPVLYLKSLEISKTRQNST